jgi:hypothetical protein
VTLEPPTDGLSRGCVEIPRALSLGLMEHPSRYYVNVHNRPFPEGAKRDSSTGRVVATLDLPKEGRGVEQPRPSLFPCSPDVQKRKIQ